MFKASWSTASLIAVLALSACGGGATPTPGSANATPGSPSSAPAREISGTVAYDGTALDGHKIVVGAVLAGTAGAPAASAVLAGPGPYRMTGLADGSYTVFAFIDLGDDMGAPGPTEPLGWYDVAADGTADPVVVASGTGVTGVDIKIRDR
jgi:hypothetical protein